MRHLALVTVLAAAACQFSPDVPEDADITCTRTTECPSNMICSSSLSRCIRRGSDETAPIVEAIDVRIVGHATDARKVVTAGDTILVDITVNEELGKNPVVRLVWLSSERGVEKVSSSGLTWTHSSTVTAEDEQGFASIEVEVVDKAGLTSNDDLPAVLEVDLDPPALVDSAVEVVYLPDPDSRLTSVIAATNDTTVQFTMLANETLATPPVVRAHPPTAAVLEVADLVSTDGNQYTFELSPAVWPEDGPYSVEVELTDEAGNTTTPALMPSRLAFVVDTQPPAAAPAVDTAGAIVLARNPWGSEATFDGGAAPPLLTLRGAPGAAEPDTTLVVLDSADPAFAVEIERVSVRATGSFGTPPTAANPIAEEPLGPLVLPRVDVDAVWLTTVDGAGNATPIVKVRDGEWTATLNGRLPGNAESNPNQLWVQTDSPPTPFGLLRREAPPTGLIAAMYPDGQTELFSAARGWLPRRPNSPAGGNYSTMVYADSRAETMVFGGFRGVLDPFPYLWNGAEWQQVVVPGLSPNARLGHSMTYDSLRDRVIVVGGATGLTQPFADIWEWTGTQWLDRTPPVAGPVARFLGSLAFDAARGRAVLFGGMGGPDPAGNCEDGNPAPAFGFCFYTDTWEWDGAGWTERCQDTECPDVPSGRVGATLTFDPNTGESILFGGCLLDPATFGCTTPLQDTWAWDGTTWHDRTPVALIDSPAGRLGHQAAYADATLSGSVGRVTLFGGCGAALDWFECPTTNDELWTWDPSTETWEEITGSGAWPQPRSGHSLAYDRLRDELVLVGGSDKRPIASSCVEPALADDTGDGFTECLFLDTWTWNWETGWARVAGQTGAPPPRRSASMAFDGTERTVLFGGQAEVATNCGGVLDSCADLWEWDGRAWNARCGPEATAGCDDGTPEERSQASMVSVGNGRVLLYGGNGCGTAEGTTGCTHVWLWDSEVGEWSLVADDTGPVGRGFTALAFDPNRGVNGTLVLFGGATNYSGVCPSYSSFMPGSSPQRCALCDTWELDVNSSTWQQKVVPAPDCSSTSGPSARRVHGMTFDTALGVTVLYGGCAAYDGDETCPTGKLSDTWTWDGVAWTRLEELSPPGPRSEPRMVFDTWRGRTIVDGGRMGGLTFPTWDRVDNSWQPIPRGTLLPPLTDGHSIAYDDVRRVMVLVTDSLDTWELNLDPRLAPSVIFEIALAHANRSGSGPTRDDAVDIDLVVDVEGRGFHNHDPAPTQPPVGAEITALPRRGAKLQAWSVADQAWVDASSNCGDAVTDPAEVRRITATLAGPSYVMGSPPKILVRLVPCFGTGSSPVPASLELDYIEATVTYRLP